MSGVLGRNETDGLEVKGRTTGVLEIVVEGSLKVLEGDGEGALEEGEGELGVSLEEVEVEGGLVSHFFLEIDEAALEDGDDAGAQGLDTSAKLCEGRDSRSSHDRRLQEHSVVDVSDVLGGAL